MRASPLLGVVLNCATTSMAGQLDSAPFATAQLVDAVRANALPALERTEHYAIYDAGVRTYPPTTFLVQSSGTPISLGADMAPYMDTSRLWAYVEANNIAVDKEVPGEVYLYNWVHRAQGAMVFDVGVTVADDTPEVGGEHGFVLKRYPAMKFASLVYEGPYPHEPNSGWDNIRWEERARQSGHVYTERLYRELYHRYDHRARRHITEIQIEIE